MVRVRRRLGHLECDIVQPPSAQGLPVVFLHGMGGGTWGWENFQNYFAARGRTSYAPELPYHGDKHDPRLGRYSVESFAMFIAGVLREVGNCFVIGHSMGGLLAQKVAETHPLAGYGFICSAPPWHFFRRAYWPMWKRVLASPLRHVIPALSRESMIPAEHLEDALVNNRLTPEMRREVYRRDVPESGRATLQMILGLVKVDERHVTAPCVVIGAQHDGLLPICEQQRIAEYYNCPLQVFDRGHMLIIEEGWEEVADYLLDWIETVERATAPGVTLPAAEGMSAD